MTRVGTPRRRGKVVPGNIRWGSLQDTTQDLQSSRIPHQTMSGDFKLSATLKGHEEDVSRIEHAIVLVVSTMSDRPASSYSTTAIPQFRSTPKTLYVVERVS